MVAAAVSQGRSWVAGRLVSYFPMAHVAERVVTHYNPIAYGHTVTCCPDPRQVTAYLPEVRTTFVFAVPRQIRRFRVLDDQWAPGGEELTRTLKLKRKPIAAKYAAEIEALYAKPAATRG
jgi:long-subunit acyl-CoA synthetase (AMP-forming)